MKKFLISGIPPSESGVGFLMKYLSQLAEKHGYMVIYPSKSISLRRAFPNPFKVGVEILNRCVRKKNFKRKLSGIKDSEVILIHPQTIGFPIYFDLLKKNSVVKAYIMDNSFFCIQSYNTLDNAECLKCLSGTENCDQRCQPFPVQYKKEDNLRCLDEFKALSHKIKFYAQNSKQADLIRKNFGETAQVKVIGLKTDHNYGEIPKDGAGKYDIVYHGANVEAKGITYTIELTNYLKPYRVLVPYNRNQLNYEGDLPENIICKTMTWNTGLKEAVTDARLVLNPSLWSAPVEGALLKSIYFNGNVGVVSTQYAFEKDIPTNVLLRLTDNLEDSAKRVTEFLENNKSLSETSRPWLKQFLEDECQLEALFSD